MISFLLFLILFSGCGSEPVIPYEIPENAVSLLTADTSKTWKIARRYNGKARMNMEGCFMLYRQKFSISGIVTDNNAENTNCGPSLNADWEITKTEKGNYYLKLTSADIPDLLNQEEDYTFFKILRLTKDSLTVSFRHKQFGKERVITDYLVQEDIVVPDRNFHW